MSLYGNWVAAFSLRPSVTALGLRSVEGHGLTPLQRKGLKICSDCKNISIGRRGTVRNVLLLGGTSGVGMETAQYLRSRCVETTAVSRRTGHDFSKANVVEELIREGSEEHIGVMVGGGRYTKMKVAEEISLYVNIIHAICRCASVRRLVFVTRALVASDVSNCLHRTGCPIPWVILRPGPMDFHPTSETNNSTLTEHLLVTADLRCNGYVSRAAVATVVGDLLIGNVDINRATIAKRVLGVYDRNRMITTTDHAVDVSAQRWGVIKY